MLLKRYKIRSYELGLVFREGEFTHLLGPGRRWLLDPLGRLQVQVVSQRAPWLVHEQLDQIVKSGALDGKATVLDLADHERALVWIDGRFSHILPPGLHAFWTGQRDIRVELVDARSVRLVHKELAAIVGRGAEIHRALDVHQIEADHAGVLLIDGQYVETLPPGRYAIWKNVATVKLIGVDHREATLDIAGQEIMTADKVTLRVNANVTYRVVDARRAVSSSDDARMALYREAQLAHAQGLVHRDIKPANISLENGVERVRITDFGLARTIDDASQSQSGFIAGTPQYMAPEQARGEPSDARADLFSLGSVMYAMCAGHPPFRAETTLAVLRRICDDLPRDLRQTNPDVPQWLAAIVHRLLAKSPDERYPSAGEVADLLERWLAHLNQPDKIAPPEESLAPGAGGVHRTTSRRWQIAALAGTALLSLVAAWAAWLNGIGLSLSTDGPLSPAAPVNGAATGPAPITPPVSRGKHGEALVEPVPSAALVDAELKRAWQETSELEARLPAAHVSNPAIGLDLVELERRLDALEWELTAPTRQPKATVPPVEPNLVPSN